MAELEQRLQAEGVDSAAHVYVQQVAHDAQAAAAAAAQGGRTTEGGAGGGGTTSGRMLSRAFELADKAGVRSMAGRVSSALAAGVRQLLPSRRETAITRAVASLMDNRGASAADDDAYAYLDPKLPPGTELPPSSRAKTAYTHAIAFVVGPGNYLEYMSLRQSAQAASQTAGTALHGRRVTYGCTEVLSSSEFLAQLSTLGKAMRPAAQ